MSIAVVITDNFSEGKRQIVIGTLTFSGSYATGGEVVSWALGAIKSQRAPKNVQIEGIAGFKYEYVAATAKVIVRGYQPTDGTGGVIALPQIAAASYPAGVTGDTVSFLAIFGQNV